MRIHISLLTISVLICLMGISASSWSISIPVEMEKKGVYICWFTYPGTGSSQQTTEPVRVQGDKAVLSSNDISSIGANSVTLYVMDKRTGNVAVLPINSKNAVQIKESAFEYVGSVSLRVVAEDGSPVESALVRVTDGAGTEHVSAITPADEGTLHLRNLAAGQINVKVQTNGLKKTLDSDINLPLERNTPGFSSDIRVSGDVNTVSVTEAKSNTSEDTGNHTENSKQNENKPHSSGGSILSSLVGLILLAMIIAVIWVVLRSKGVTAKDALQKMGVQVTDDNQGQTTSTASQSPIPAVDSNKCPFCGQDKDASGNCACSLSGSAQPSTVSSSAVFAPKLVGSQGTYAMRVFELGASSVVGREPNCDISLSEDSTVSRRHAVITVSGGECRIKDEGSSNGSYVNGAKITEQVLNPGDELRIGETKFRYEV